MPDCVRSFKFLNKTYCDEICNRVHNLKDKWISRGGYFDYPFYTLGVASYLDAREDSKFYYEHLPNFNPILKENFADLYSKTKIILEEKLSKQCTYDENLAIPGFHIFLDSDFFEIPVASKHVDLQYQLVNWNSQSFDPKNNISFTVYTSLPSNGGGLNFWNYTYGDLSDLDNNARNEKLSDEAAEFIPFEIGDLVIHTGFNYHQIAPMIDVQPGDQRISLQGHGVLINDIYHLYW